MSSYSTSPSQSRTSRENAAGCSQATMCPAFGMTRSRETDRLILSGTSWVDLREEADPLALVRFQEAKGWNRFGGGLLRDGAARKASV